MSIEKRCTNCQQPSTDIERGVCRDCRQPEHAQSAPTDSLRENQTVAPSGQAKEAQSVERSTERLGDYDLIEEIARGGMGVVYKARHRKLNRIAALKMILAGRFSSAEELQRFQIEAESAAKLDHPSIVPVYEIGEAEGQAFFAMKYVEGGPLSDRIAEFQANPRKSVQLLANVASAVHHAHQRGVLHRDLKPANILLDENDLPMVTDLGLAKNTGGGSDLTHTGAVLGTPSYMPPEQASGGAVTTAADIYALGAIMYELLIGRPPYVGDSSMEVVMKVIEGPPQAPHKIQSGVDRDLELICLKCMEREPERRYLTAQEFASDLTSWLDGEAISIKPPSMIAVASRWMRNNRQIVYACFAILMGILACTPLAISFLSDEKLTDIYSRFPAEQRPWLYSFDSIPKSFSFASVMLLLFVLWPSIGLLNAAIAKPVSIAASIRSGVLTSFVLAVLFFLLIGWMVFLQGAANDSRGKIRTLADGIWPGDRTSKEQAEAKANQMFEGLEKIPENERSAIVAGRIEADQFASAPISFLIALSVSVIFSIPIIYGTVIGFVVLNRKTFRWVAILRYAISWWSISSFLLVGILSIIGNENGRSLITIYPIWVVTIQCLLAVILAATLRKWNKLPSGLRIQPASSTT